MNVTARGGYGAWRSRARFALIACAGLALAACSSAGSSSSSSGSSSGAGPVTIALTTDLSGAFAASVGIPTAAGAEAAIARINSQGGIDGRKIKIAGPYDSQSSSTGGQQAALQAVAAKPAAILSLGDSEAWSAGVPTFSQADIPVMNVSAGQDAYQPVRPWSYGVSFTVAQVAGGLLAKATQLLGGSLQGKHLSLVELNDGYVLDALAEFKTEAQAAGATIVDTQETQLTTTSFTAQGQQIVRAKPDLIVDLDIPSNTTLTVTSVRSGGYKGAILTWSGEGADSALKAINDATFYAARPTTVAAPGTPLYAAAQKFGGASQAAASNYYAWGWAAAYATEAILAKCGNSCSTAKFSTTADTMGSIQIPLGATYGPVLFSATNHAGLTEVQYYTWDPSTNEAVADGAPTQLQS